jgi:hypothetical protein
VETTELHCLPCTDICVRLSIYELPHPPITECHLVVNCHNTTFQALSTLFKGPVSSLFNSSVPLSCCLQRLVTSHLFLPVCRSSGHLLYAICF